MKALLTDMSLAVHYATPPALFFSCVTLVALYLYIKGRGLEMRILSLSTIFSALIVVLLKNYLEIPRSSGALVSLESSAFPSGHATGSMMLAVTLSYIFAHRMPRRKKYLLTTVLFLLALFVGYSRIAIGVHTPAQVLTGYLVGVGTSLFVIWMYGRRLSR